MRQTLHIMKKDLRRLRWLVAVWAAIVAGRVLLQTVAPVAAAETFERRFVLEQVRDLALLLELLMMALIAARLVHEDAPASLNAFWLTHPYDRISLLTAKLALAAAELAVVPAAGDVATMLWARAGATDIAVAIPGFLRSHGFWALGFMVVAVLTGSLGAFMLAFVGIAAGLAAIVTVLMMVSLLMAEESRGGTPSFVSDATPGLIATAVFFAATVFVVVYQYRCRRRGRAVAIAVAGLVATLVVPTYWPWRFAAQPEPDPGAWARDTARTAVIAEVADQPDLSGGGAFGGSGELMRRLSARIELKGIPPEFSVETIGVRGQLRLPDGNELQSQFTGGLTRVVGPGGTMTSSTLQAVVGDSVLLSDDALRDGPLLTWLTLLQLSDSEYRRYRGQSGRFDGMLDLYLNRSRAVGVLPLMEGAALDGERSRIDLLRVRRRPESIVVIARQWRVGSIFEAARNRQYEFVLRNRSRGQAIRIDGEHFGTTMSGDSGFGGVLVPLTLVAARAELHRGLLRPRVPAADAAWCKAPADRRGLAGRRRAGRGGDHIRRARHSPGDR